MFSLSSKAHHPPQHQVYDIEEVVAKRPLFYKMKTGWAYDEVNQRPIYIRQLRDAKIKPVVSVMKPSNLFFYAEIYGQALASAHSRSDDAVVLSGYMGENSTFTDAIADFAVAYAGQNYFDGGKDYEYRLPPNIPQNNL